MQIYADMTGMQRQLISWITASSRELLCDTTWRKPGQKQVCFSAVQGTG